jgi:hypothetical protein
MLEDELLDLPKIGGSNTSVSCKRYRRQPEFAFSVCTTNVDVGYPGQELAGGEPCQSHN